MKAKKIFFPATIGMCVLIGGFMLIACVPEMAVVEPPTLSLDDDPTGYNDWLGSPSAWTCDESDTGSPSAWGSGELIVDLPRSYGAPSKPAGATSEELRVLRESINRAERAKDAAPGSDKSPKPKKSDDHHP